MNHWAFPKSYTFFSQGKMYITWPPHTHVQIHVRSQMYITWPLLEYFWHLSIKYPTTLKKFTKYELFIFNINNKFIPFTFNKNVVSQLLYHVQIDQNVVKISQYFLVGCFIIRYKRPTPEVIVKMIFGLQYLGKIVDTNPTLGLHVSYQIQIEIFYPRENTKKVWLHIPSYNSLNTLQIIKRRKWELVKSFPKGNNLSLTNRFLYF